MQKWTAQIDQNTQAFETAFGDVTLETLNWKPNGETWSIAQNLDHLIIINSSYFPILEALHEGTYKTPLAGKLSFLVSFFGKTVLKAVQPDRKTKIKTFPIWEPAQSDLSNTILEDFKAHHLELKTAISDAQPFVERGTVISSPANKNLVYTLECAFDIIIAHEQRHLEQAKEVLQMMSATSN
ncbi:MAG: DinB family protein [Bacteroidota bacterium]